MGGVAPGDKLTITDAEVSFGVYLAKRLLLADFSQINNTVQIPSSKSGIMLQMALANA